MKGLEDVARALVGVRLVLRSGGSSADVAAPTLDVPPPLVRDAVVLMATANGAAAGDRDDSALFRQAAARWLSREAFGVVFSPLLSERDRAEAVLRALTAFVEAHTAPTKGAKDEGKEDQRPPLAAVLAQYRALYHTDPLCEPWPIFVMMAQQMTRVEARGQYSWMTAYAAVRASEDATRAIYRQAFPESAPVAVEIPEWMDDDFVAAQVAKAKAYAKRHLMQRRN